MAYEGGTASQVLTRWRRFVSKRWGVPVDGMAYKTKWWRRSWPTRLSAETVTKRARVTRRSSRASPRHRRLSRLQCLRGPVLDLRLNVSVEDRVRVRAWLRTTECVRASFLRRISGSDPQNGCAVSGPNIHVAQFPATYAESLLSYYCGDTRHEVVCGGVLYPVSKIDKSRLRPTGTPLSIRHHYELSTRTRLSVADNTIIRSHPPDGSNFRQPRTSSSLVPHLAIEEDDPDQRPAQAKVAQGGHDGIHRRGWEAGAKRSGEYDFEFNGGNAEGDGRGAGRPNRSQSTRME